MLGRSLEALEVSARPSERPDSDVPLRVQRLAKPSALRDVSLAVHRGEIVCVTGAIGSGRRELARCIAGIDRAESGSIELA
jgi:ABC-type sugar transport system ATPase subunit